jgi:hypothetical protein
LAILQEPGYVSLEDYVDANVLIGALQRYGPRLDTEQLVGTLENLRDLDVGLGTPASFTGSEHQCGAYNSIRTATISHLTCSRVVD